jgi:hypothetical protein
VAASRGAGLQPRPLPGVPGEARRPLELGPRLLAAPQSLEELGAGGGQQVIARELRMMREPIEQGEPDAGPSARDTAIARFSSMTGDGLSAPSSA